MRDRNSTLGASALTAIVKRARYKAAFDGPGKRIKERTDAARDKAKAEREADAAEWIARVKARRG